MFIFLQYCLFYLMSGEIFQTPVVGQSPGTQENSKTHFLQCRSAYW